MKSPSTYASCGLSDHLFHTWPFNTFLRYSCATSRSSFFFFNDTATTEIYTLSLHDALPISRARRVRRRPRRHPGGHRGAAGSRRLRDEGAGGAVAPAPGGLPCRPGAGAGGGAFVEGGRAGGGAEIGRAHV